MLFETPAMPMPAPIFANTMARAVKSPMASGPTYSMRGSSRTDSKSLTLYITRDISPRIPHVNKNPNPMPNVSFVSNDMSLNINS